MSGSKPSAGRLALLFIASALVAPWANGCGSGSSGAGALESVPDAASPGDATQTSSDDGSGDDASGTSRNDGGGSSSGAGPGADSGGPGEASVADAGGSGSCSAAQVGPDGDFKGYRMFPADHPINTPIDTLLPSAHSADWLANCSSAHPYLQIDLSMPYNIVAANTPTVTATNLDYNSKPYPNPWPFPASALIEQGDGHCLAFDVGTCKLYEVYNFAWGAGKTSFTGGSGTVWDTTNDAPGQRQRIGRRGLADHAAHHSLR